MKSRCLPKQAENIAEIFRSSMEFAGLQRNGILHSTISIADGIGAAEPITSDATARSLDHALPAPGPADADPIAAIVGSSERLKPYSIPLHCEGRTAVIYLPTPISRLDILRIRAWAEFMEGLADEAP